MKLKPKVLFINHVSSKQYGGAEKVLDDVISGLLFKGYNITLLLQDASVSGATSVDFDCASKVDVEYFDFGKLTHKSKILAIITMLFRMIKSFFFIRALIKKNNVDIVCANSLIAGIFSSLPARIFCKRFYYYEHNIATQRKGHLIGMALMPITKLASKIICISQSVKESLLQEGVSESKLFLVHNGYDFTALDIISGPDDYLPFRHQINKLRIGMVANFIPWKRHKLFIDLMDRLSFKFPDIEIDAILVGGMLPGNESYYHEIADWIEAYSGAVNFEMTGFQNNVAKYIKSFDILINPAEAEPFGLIFIEAMYLECVVFGSISGAAPEIITNDETGFIVDYDDFDSTTEKIAMLSVNVNKRIDIGHEASKRVRVDFSIEKQIDKLEAVFN